MRKNPYEAKGWEEGKEMHPGGLSLTKELLLKVPLKKGDKVLDAGCGRGVTVHYLLDQGYDALGIDPSEVLIQEAKRKGHEEAFLTGNVEKLPFEDGEFFLVVSECVLSIVEDKVRALKELYRVLCPGGFLILSDLLWEKGHEGRAMWGNLNLWQEWVIEAGFKIFEAGKQEAALRDFYLQAVWEGKDDFLKDCLPKGIPGREFSYFSLIGQKGGESDGGDGCLGAPDHGAHL